MAGVNGARRSHHLDPPPSSILATRIGNADDTLELNQASFDQLLTESLGNDEFGQPNLGGDTSVNLKVIEIVLKAGIDPRLRDSIDNPFQDTGVHTKSVAQFLACFEVIGTAIERSPSVLFTKSSITGRGTNVVEQPLYVWLLPKLISALTPHSSPECIRAIAGVISTCIQREQSRGLTAPDDTVLDFTLGCVSGKLKILRSRLRRQTDIPSLDRDWSCP